jgi:hypothetical protein
MKCFIEFDFVAPCKTLNRKVSIENAYMPKLLLVGNGEQ